MSTQRDARPGRYLGAAFVFQFVTSLTAGLLSAGMLTGSPVDVVRNIASNVGQMRASIVLMLLTSAGIIVLASLLYAVLSDQGTAVARIALGLWMAEAVMLAVKTLGLYALVDLSLGAVDGGAVGGIALDFSRHAAQIDMLFFCLGALLWYGLLFRSRIVPRLLALWGLVAVPLVLLATALLVWDSDRDLGMALYALYIPFELVIGVWLLVVGASAPTSGLGAGDENRTRAISLGS
ncbi:DUF4386 domain-containing protein [Cellulomonas sp. ICMP 17802]|uniref:DUF4386 domain-containing protein n=1 Tax=Cellulomonas sp. ICMP 17802 TaxID=3239199 RepID=UPI00351BCB04